MLQCDFTYPVLCDLILCIDLLDPTVILHYHFISSFISLFGLYTVLQWFTMVRLFQWFPSFHCSIARLLLSFTLCVSLIKIAPNHYLGSSNGFNNPLRSSILFFFSVYSPRLCLHTYVINLYKIL